MSLVSFLPFIAKEPGLGIVTKRGFFEEPRYISMNIAS
jgi:hypothetical protein